MKGRAAASEWSVSRRVVLLIAAIAVALGAAFAVIAGRTPDPSAVPTSEEVSKRVMSPFCPGLTLAECPTRQAAELRTRIEEKISAGWTNRQIDAWLVANYGEGALGRPPEAAVWAVPAILLAAGVLIVALLVARWAGGRGRAPDPDLTGPERELVELDLRRFSEEATE
jgi:cytochrome c-type biogenesis protein CcmH